MQHLIDLTPPRQMAVAAVEFLGISFLGGGECSLVFRAENVRLAGENEDEATPGLAAVLLPFAALFEMQEAVGAAMDRLAEEVIADGAAK